MSSATLDSLAGQQVLQSVYGRAGDREAARDRDVVHHLSREVYLFAEHGEAAGWVKNIRRSANVSVRIVGHILKAVAKVLDYQKDRQLWDEVQAIAHRKYGWGDGLPVKITPAA